HRPGGLRRKLPSRKLRMARDKGDPHAGLADRSGGAGGRVRGHAQPRAAPAALRRRGAQARRAARRGARRRARRHRGSAPPRGAASRDGVDSGGVRGGSGRRSRERAADARAPARLLDHPQARLGRRGLRPARDAAQGPHGILRERLARPFLHFFEADVENLRVAALLHEVGTRDQRLLRLLSRSVTGSSVGVARAMRGAAEIIGEYGHYYEIVGEDWDIEALPLPLTVKILAVADAFETL